jgi:hypothetical protein
MLVSLDCCEFGVVCLVVLWIRRHNGKPQTSRDTLSSWDACFIGSNTTTFRPLSLSMTSHRPREETLSSWNACFIGLLQSRYRVFGPPVDPDLERYALLLECLFHWNSTILFQPREIRSPIGMLLFHWTVIRRQGDKVFLLCETR